MKTPEQIADEMFNSDISLSQDDKAVIIAAIKADRAQPARYYVEIEYSRSGNRWGDHVTVEPGESIVEAIVREGAATEEWTLIDAERVIA